jgi:phage shock protein PspC (stress-responsive transcriptional regulator)
VVDHPNDRDTAGPTPAAPGATPPPPGGDDGPATSPRPPLRRPREGRVLAGVAAGIADHLGVDVVIVRIVIVVLAVLTEGLLALAYLAAAIFVPAAEPGAPRPEHRRGDATSGERDPLFWVGVGVVVIGAIWLTRGAAAGVAILPGGRGFGDLVVPLVLIAFGLALWRAGDRREPDPANAVPGPTYRASSGPTYPGSPGPTYRASSGPTYPRQQQAPASGASKEPPMTTETQTPPPAASGRTGAAHPTQGAGGNPPPPPGTGQPYGEPQWSPPPAPEPRERSLLTRATLGIAFVLIGVLWSLRVAGVVMIGWGTILAAALLVIGIGLLIGSVFGRGRWLILAGVLIAPIVVVSQVAPFATFADGWNVDSSSAGEIRSTPSDLTELRSDYQLGAGSVRLDLTELDLEGEDVAVRVDIGAGEIRVVVPDDVEVDATARTGIGQVRLFDVRAAGGIGPGEQQATFAPDGESRGRIQLELQTGLGEIRVESAPSRLGPPEEPTPEPGPDPDREAEPELEPAL